MDRQCAPKHAGLHIALDSLLSAAALALAVNYTKYFYNAIISTSW